MNPNGIGLLCGSMITLQTTSRGTKQVVHCSFKMNIELCEFHAGGIKTDSVQNVNFKVANISVYALLPLLKFHKILRK